jgi:thioredoxin 1
MNAKVIDANETNFEREVLNANGIVLVEFWAGWSDACKAMTPLIESIAESENGPVKVARVKVEHQKALAEQYGVGAVPTLLIFDQGTLQDQIVGRIGEEELRNRLGCYA